MSPYRSSNTRKNIVSAFILLWVILTTVYAVSICVGVLKVSHICAKNSTLLETAEQLQVVSSTSDFSGGGLTAVLGTGEEVAVDTIVYADSLASDEYVYSDGVLLSGLPSGFWRAYLLGSAYVLVCGATLLSWLCLCVWSRRMTGFGRGHVMVSRVCNGRVIMVAGVYCVSLVVLSGLLAFIML